MKRQCIVKTLVAASAILLILTMGVIQANAFPKGWPNQIVITSGPMVGSWYASSVKLSEYLMKKFPGLSVTVIEGGGVGNVRLLEKGRDAQIGITHSAILGTARKGIAAFEGEKHVNSNALFAIMPSTLKIVVRADSKIFSVSDLKDKRIVPGRKMDTATFLFRTVLKQYGLSFTTIRKNGGKITFTGYTEAPLLFKDNHIDCAVVFGKTAHPVISNIQSRIPLRILPIEKPVMQAVMEEKSMRIAEVIIGSVKPFDFMMGKLIGGVSVSLTAAGFYVLVAVIGLPQLGVGEYIPYHLLPWFFAYVIISIFMYGALLAALGSACNDLAEAQSITFPAMIPMMLPIFIAMPVIQNPESGFATAVSLFPPFTPLLMMMRQATPGGIPAWQPWVGLVGAILFTIFLIWIGGRIFRVAILLQGTPPKLKHFVRWAIRG